MKKTNGKALRIIEIMRATQETLLSIKGGNKSLGFNPSKGKCNEEEPWTIQDQAILLIAQIIEYSADNYKDGLRIIKEAKQTYIGYHSEDES